MASIQKQQQSSSTAPGLDDVNRFFADYGEALPKGGTAVAKFWGIPSLVLGDAQVHAVSSSAEVVAFFDAGLQQYASQGIRSATPTVQNVDRISDRIAIARVKWSNRDERSEVGSETNVYTLMRGEDGNWKIQVSITAPPRAEPKA